MAKVKKCRYCHEQFTPAMPLQVACSPRCAIELVKSKQKLERKRETRKLKEKIKSRSDWMKEAQSAFNAWIKERDSDLPCVSCGRFHNGQWHAGHYLSVGSRPNLRFNENNVWKQCAPCNTYLSGNLILYRQELIKRIGLAKVEILESDRSCVKYTIDELKNIIKEYKIRISSLKKERI